MPTTITTYNVFAAGTKARASEVNQNFSNYRGTLIPISESNAEAEGNTHDLGTLEHQWRNLYLQNAPYVNGSQQVVTPTGVIMPYAGTSAPAGFLFCDGSSINRVTYAALFNIIGEYWGSGDLSTTFNIPDVRGRAIRFADAGAGRDLSAATRSSSLANFTGTGTVVSGTTGISNISIDVFGRLRVGSRVWGPDNITTTQGRIYANSTTIASIPAAQIVLLQSGFPIWGTVLSPQYGYYTIIPTTTVTSVNTVGFSMVIGKETREGDATATADFFYNMHLFPTSTIVSIDTATTSIVISSTATISQVAASLVFDRGGDNIGSTQDDAMQGHHHRKSGITRNYGGTGVRFIASNVGNGPGDMTNADTITQSWSDNEVRFPVSDIEGNGVPRYAPETRMTNIYANAVIKF